MFQSRLPKFSSGESILVATYILNRLASSILKLKAPFELLYKKKPEYCSLKVFGCLCYIVNTLPHKDKFDQRAHK